MREASERHRGMRGILVFFEGRIATLVRSVPAPK
jgi:hypothetical protein